MSLMISVKSQLHSCPRERGIFYATSPDCIFYYRCKNNIVRAQICYPWQRFDIHSLMCRRRWEVDCNPMYAGIWRPLFGERPGLEGGGEIGINGELPGEIVGTNPLEPNPEIGEIPGGSTLGQGIPPVLSTGTVEGTVETSQINPVQNPEISEIPGINSLGQGIPLVLPTGTVEGSVEMPQINPVQNPEISEIPGTNSLGQGIPPVLPTGTIDGSIETPEINPVQNPEQNPEISKIQGVNSLGQGIPPVLPPGTVEGGVEIPDENPVAESLSPEKISENKQNSPINKQTLQAEQMPLEIVSLTAENESIAEEISKMSEDESDAKQTTNSEEILEPEEITKPEKMSLVIGGAPDNLKTLEEDNSSEAESLELEDFTQNMTTDEESTEVPASVTEVKAPAMGNITVEIERPTFNGDLPNNGSNGDVKNQPTTGKKDKSEEQANSNGKPSISSILSKMEGADHDLNVVPSLRSENKSEEKNLTERCTINEESSVEEAACKDENNDPFTFTDPDSLSQKFSVKENDSSDNTLPQNDLIYLVDSFDGKSDLHNAEPVREKRQDMSGMIWHWCGSGRFVLAPNSTEGDSICLQLPDPESMNAEGGQTGGDWAGHTFLDKNGFSE